MFEDDLSEEAREFQTQVASVYRAVTRGLTREAASNRLRELGFNADRAEAKAAAMIERYELERDVLAPLGHELAQGLDRDTAIERLVRDHDFPPEEAAAQVDALVLQMAQAKAFWAELASDILGGTRDDKLLRRCHEQGLTLAEARDLIGRMRERLSADGQQSRRVLLELTQGLSPTDAIQLLQDRGMPPVVARQFVAVHADLYRYWCGWGVLAGVGLVVVGIWMMLCHAFGVPGSLMVRAYEIGMVAAGAGLAVFYARRRRRILPSSGSLFRAAHQRGGRAAARAYLENRGFPTAEATDFVNLVMDRNVVAGFRGIALFGMLGFVLVFALVDAIAFWWRPIDQGSAIIFAGLKAYFVVVLLIGCYGWLRFRR
jgi:hypothetical protein